MDSQTECPTFDEIRSNLALPEKLVGLLGSSLQSLGYNLQTLDGYDVAGVPFKYYEARNGAGSKPFTLLYVRNLEERRCVNMVSALGFVFRDKQNPLIIFSDGDHVDPAYNDMAEMWQSMGPEYVRFYSAYEIGLLERDQTNAAAVARRVKKYLGIGDQQQPPPAADDAQPAAAAKKKRATDVINIFISYSHKDEQYFGDTSLVGYLSGLKKHKVEFWSDKVIPVGSKWDEFIRERMSESHIALFLVSQFFLDSDYCTETEIPTFIKQAEEDGLVIFPIMLSRCEWGDEHKWLSERQFIPSKGNIAKDYKDEGDRLELFAEIRKSLLDTINNLRNAGGESTGH